MYLRADLVFSQRGGFSKKKSKKINNFNSADDICLLYSNWDHLN